MSSAGQWGVTPSGFVPKPLANIISDMQAEIWATIDPTLDLSAQSPDGKMLAIYAQQCAANWLLLEQAFNQFNREDAEGASLDNLGDLTGTPREGASYTQVYCTIQALAENAPYPAGSLVANVAGLPAQTFSNANTITAAQFTPNVAIIGCTNNAGLIEVQTAAATGLVTGNGITISNVLGTTEANASFWLITVIDSTHFTLDGSTFSNAYLGGGTVTYGSIAVALFQSTTSGETPAVNDNTLNTITTAVTGWFTVNNPGSQIQAGTDSELDPAYMLRQVEDLAASGSCNPSSTAEALLTFAANLQPPVAIAVEVLENPQWFAQVINGLGLPPHTYAVIVYDSTGTLTPAQIGQIVYDNKPAGGTSYGSIPVVITDPVLGQQTVYYNVPAALPLYITAVITLRTGADATAVYKAIRAALVAAAVAPTPANGEPAPGQLVPGGNVYGSQLQAVIASVPGVLDVTGAGGPGTSLAFGFTSSPTNTGALTVTANEVATILAATVGTNVVLT